MNLLDTFHNLGELPRHAIVSSFVLPVGRHCTDANGVFTQMNDVELRWLGYTREEVIGKLRPADVLSPASRHDFTMNFARLIERGYVRDLEYEFRRKDGTTLFGLVHAVAIKGVRGECLGGRAIIIDITDRKRAELALARSEANLRHAQRIAHIGSYEIDCSLNSGNMQCLWSEEAYRILGLDAGQGPLSSTDFLERCVHADDRERVTRVIETAFRDGVAADCEYRIVRGDGEVRHVHDVAEPARGANGNIERYIGMIHDITLAKQAEQRLRENQQQFGALVANSHDGIILLSASGEILFASQSAQRLLGYTQDELVGHYSHEFCHPDDVAGVTSGTEQLLAQPETALTHEFRVSHPDGSWRWLEARKSNLLHHPALRAIVCNFRDITAQRQARDALRASNRRLHQLSQHLQNLSEHERACLARELHDELGATLSSINLYLGDAACDTVKPEALARIRALVGTAVKTTRRITSDLRPSMLDHRGLWAAIERLADDTLAARDIACNIDFGEVRELAPDQVTGIAVFRIVQEALLNTLRHAEASEVRISARRESRQLILCILDNGSGINLQDSTKTGSWGITGMCERARGLGGELVVRRAAAGGTEVQLRLPLPARERAS